MSFEIIQSCCLFPCSSIREIHLRGLHLPLKFVGVDFNNTIIIDFKFDGTNVFWDIERFVKNIYWLFLQLFLPKLFQHRVSFGGSCQNIRTRVSGSLFNRGRKTMLNSTSNCKFSLFVTIGISLFHLKTESLILPSAVGSDAVNDILQWIIWVLLVTFEFYMG